MGKFLVDLPDNQLGTLRKISSETGTPVAHYLRQMVSKFLDSESPAKLVMSGASCDGVVFVVK